MTVLWIVFLIANIFLTTWIYRLTRRFGTSQLEFAKEAYLMSSAEVGAKKVVTWGAIYLVTTVLLIAVAEKMFRSDKNENAGYVAPPKQKTTVITDSKQFLGQ